MKKINVPCLIILLILILGGVACVFSPTIAAWYIAGSQDGFTIEAFDVGWSDWWDVGTFWAIGVIVVSGIVLVKVIDAGRREVL